MRHSLHLARNLAVMPLCLELAHQPELWNQHPARLSEHGPHYQSDDIWLRYKDETENRASGDYSNFADPHDPIWYPAYDTLPSARKLIFDLMAYVHGERLGGVLISRLPPGKRILPHVDQGWHVDYYDKFNICLQASDRARVCYDDESFTQRPGDVHWFRNSVRHEVINDGDEDRIVMIVCIRLRKPLCPTGM